MRLGKKQAEEHVQVCAVQTHKFKDVSKVTIFNQKEKTESYLASDIDYM